MRSGWSHLDSRERLRFVVLPTADGTGGDLPPWRQIPFIAWAEVPVLTL